MTQLTSQASPLFTTSTELIASAFNKIGEHGLVVSERSDTTETTIKVKEGLSAKDKEKALIRKIVSFFDKENFKEQFLSNNILITSIVNDKEILAMHSYMIDKTINRASLSR